MNSLIRPGLGSLLAIVLLGTAGCASGRKAELKHETDLEQMALHNPPAKVRLNSYSKVELKSVNVESSKRNRELEELVRRTDGLMQYGLVPLWKEVTLVPRDIAFTTPSPGTLQIEPMIVETKTVSELDRDILTWSMGDSYMVVKVVSRDGGTGEAIAEPVFYRKADAFWATWYGGKPDRNLDVEIARGILNYTKDNL